LTTLLASASKMAEQRDSWVIKGSAKDQSNWSKKKLKFFAVHHEIWTKMKCYFKDN